MSDETGLKRLLGRFVNEAMVFVVQWCCGGGDIENWRG